MNIKSNKGFTLVELIVVMAILAIVGTTLLTLLGTGGNLFRRSDDTFKAQTEARIAMSYVTVKIRQNDRTRGIIASSGSKDVDGRTVLGGRWFEIVGTQSKIIYFADGKLMESGSSQPIAENLDDFDINMNNNQIDITIAYEDGGGTKTLQETVILRSEQ